MNALNLVLSIALFLLISVNVSLFVFLFVAWKGHKIKDEELDKKVEEVESLRRVTLSVTSMGMIFSHAARKDEYEEAVKEYNRWRYN